MCVDAYRSWSAGNAPCNVILFFLVVFSFSLPSWFMMLFMLMAVLPSSERTPPWANFWEPALPLWREGRGRGGGGVMGRCASCKRVCVRKDVCERGYERVCM